MEFLQETVNVDRDLVDLIGGSALIGQLHMDAITEGVETEEQVEALAQMGCQHFQGYYFCRPMPVDQFEKKNIVSESYEKKNIVCGRKVIEILIIFAIFYI